jgi:hypothetical protein
MVTDYLACPRRLLRDGWVRLNLLTNAEEGRPYAIALKHVEYLRSICRRPVIKGQGDRRFRLLRWNWIRLRVGIRTTNNEKHQSSQASQDNAEQKKQKFSHRDPPS